MNNTEKIISKLAVASIEFLKAFALTTACLAVCRQPIPLVLQIIWLIAFSKCLLAAEQTGETKRKGR